MNEKMYTMTSPIGNAIAPNGPLTEQELRDFGAQLSAEEIWKAKFLGDPIDVVIGYFKTAGYSIKEN